MSGGSMDYLYLRVRDAEFHINSPEREAFRKHLMLVAKALRSIEWNDSGDGDDQEVPNIMACISQSASENDRLRAEIERLHNEDTKTRHALKGWVYVCPDGGDEPTHERVAVVVAEVEKLRAALRDIERGDYSDPMCERTPEQRAREALEAKP